MKICRKCNTEKELTEFYKHPSTADRRDTICKKCKLDNQRVDRKLNPDRHSAYQLRRSIQTKYGISWEEYERMGDDQAWRCLICQRHQDDLTRRLVVDHDHETGKIRGLLCQRCNSALGYLEDSALLVGRALAHLEANL